MKPRQARRGRLTRSAEFERVYRHGRATANRHLVLYRFPSADPGGPGRVGLSVSRKIGGAVERNRVKRVLREAVASLADELGDGDDLVVVARPEVMGAIEADGLAGVEAALRDLLERAGGNVDHGRPQRGAGARREAA